MRAADVVLCRSGASTIAELTLVGAPSVLVPSPYVTNNHQEANALELEKAGAAKMIREKDCTGKVLFDTVKSLLLNRDKLMSMSENAASLGVHNSAALMADIILSHVK